MIKQMTWKEARSLFLKVRPDFVKIVDKIDPNDEYLIFVCNYPYGEKIVDRGAMHLPTQKGKANGFESLIINNIKNNLTRRSVPISFMLNNVSEVYYEFPERIISLNIFEPGHIFGLWENLDPTLSYFVKRIWSVTSGARSLYMLPKITDVTCHKELKKKYQLRSNIPKNLLDHWKIFVELTNSHNFPEKWSSQIAFFSDKWIETAINDSSWNDFYNFLLFEGWNQSQYWRNKVTFDINWELFIKSLIKQNVRSNQYFVSIVKHLILIGTGVIPGFTAASDDALAPISGIQKTYIEDYRLKDYIPTIMEPYIFSTSSEKPAYYSLQSPILLETPFLNRAIPSILSVMPEIMFLMDHFQSAVLHQEIHAENTPIEDFAKKIVCDYFHSEGDGSNNIRSTKEMPKEDKILLSLSGEYKNRIFAETAHFIRGCIRLAPRKT